MRSMPKPTGRFRVRRGLFGKAILQREYAEDEMFMSWEDVAKSEGRFSRGHIQIYRRHAKEALTAVYPLIRQQVNSEEVVQMMRNVDGCDSCQEAIHNLKDKTDD